MGLEKNQIENSNLDNDEISLKDLIIKIKYWWQFFKSKWVLIFSISLIGGILGLTVGLFEKPIYTASLSFAMEEDKGSSGGGLSNVLGLASSFGVDLGGGGSGGAFVAGNLSELMKSRLIVEKALLDTINVNGQAILLIEYYIKVSNLREKWSKNLLLNSVKFLPETSRENYTLLQDSVLKIIYKNLINKNNLSIAQKDKKVTILTVDVNNEDELFAKIFCEKLANKTSNFYIETKSKKARLNVSVLQKQVDSIRGELNTSISGVANEVDNVYNLNPALNKRGAPSKKKQIDVQANTVILTNLVVQLELAKITLRKETPLIQEIDKPILPLEKYKFGKLKFIILGGFLACFSTLIFLVFKQVLRDALY
jgi:hypothetical protein